MSSCHLAQELQSPLHLYTAAWTQTSAVVLIQSYTAFYYLFSHPKAAFHFQSSTVVEKHKFSSPFAVRGRINRCEIKLWKANVTWWRIYPELIRKSMFPSLLITGHNMLIDFFFSLCLPHFHECFFTESLFFLFYRYSSAYQQWEKSSLASACKLTEGRGGDVEEDSEASPWFVTIGQLRVRETRVNRAVWSHRAALIKGGSLSSLSVSNVLSVSSLPSWLTDK